MHAQLCHRDRRVASVIASEARQSIPRHDTDCHGLRPRNDARFRHRARRVASVIAKPEGLRQSMTLASVIASEARQSIPLHDTDCHGLRPRNDARFCHRDRRVTTVIASAARQSMTLASVIASQARQSIPRHDADCHGLRPRNDARFCHRARRIASVIAKSEGLRQSMTLRLVIASAARQSATLGSVIASEARQSIPRHDADCHGLRPRNDARFRHRDRRVAPVIASEARQSIPLYDIDCHGLRPRNDARFCHRDRCVASVIASEARQSMPLHDTDCHGLRPRNDARFCHRDLRVASVIAKPEGLRQSMTFASVIASEARQSTTLASDIASAARQSMTFASVIASEARQSIPRHDTDCHGLRPRNDARFCHRDRRVAPVIASEARQSIPHHTLDCHGLRPRNDALSCHCRIAAILPMTDFADFSHDRFVPFQHSISSLPS
jgi:hypothetical protein